MGDNLERILRENDLRLRRTSRKGKSRRRTFRKGKFRRRTSRKGKSRRK